MASTLILIQRMRYWCSTVSLGYDQNQRWNIKPGGECDCSSLVIWALREAGFSTGNASYTGNMSAELTARGWRRVANNGAPQPGDILLNDVHHVAVCLGGGLLAQASIDERGRASGGAGGDQTGHETNVRGYYNYPWNCYLRYVGGGASDPNAGKAKTKTDGQLALDVDGSLGGASMARFQQVMGTRIDGIKSSPSDCIKAFQRFLNSVVSVKDITNLGASGATRGRLDTDGYDGAKTWKAFQYWAWNIRPDLVKAYAPGWGFARFIDGDPGSVTVKILQHILNESYSGSGKLLKR